MEPNYKMSASEKMNAKLEEPPGRTFERGKWRWWYFMLFVGEIICAILTYLIYPDAFGVVILILAGALAWLFVGTLHYSGSKDKTLAIRVAQMDSLALLGTLAHLILLLYIGGHYQMLKSAESGFVDQAKEYNQTVERLTKTQADIAKSEAAKARSEQQKDFFANLFGGGKSPRRPPAAAASSNNQLQLMQPNRPTQSSVEFLASWDAWIRIAAGIPLVMTALIFIYIRLRTASTNAQANPEGARATQAEPRRLTIPNPQPSYAAPRAQQEYPVINREQTGKETSH